MDATSESPKLELHREGAGAVIVLGGRWALASSRPSRAEAEAALREGPAGSLTFTTKDLDRWDASLAVVVAALVDTAAEAGWKVDLSGLPEALPRLLALRKAAEVPPGEHARDPNMVARVGLLALSMARDARDGLEFVGELMLALRRLIRGQARWRRSDFWVVVQETGFAALPIITLISFLVGVIIAFLGAVVLKRFAADYFVSYLVGYGILREMGAIMAGIIMAGRTGAAFAAEIGSMKVTEELDALRTFGLPPMEFLVLPRVIALSVMMPLLTIYADAVGIFGGYLISLSMLDISPPQFLDGLLEAVEFEDFAIGVIKGTVFGLIVAICGCLKGLQCGTSADAVGRAATEAVVMSVTLIIVATAAIDMVAAMLGV